MEPNTNLENTVQDKRKNKKVIIISFIVLLILAVCKSFTDPSLENSISMKKAIAICTTSALFNQPTNTIHVKQTEDEDIFYLHYIRKDDNTRWGNYCLVSGGYVLWAAGAMPNDPTFVGRWRTEDKIKYQITDDTIIITELFSDNSKRIKSFPYSISKNNQVSINL